MKICYFNMDKNKYVNLTPTLTKEQEMKLLKYGVTAIMIYQVCNGVNVYASGVSISKSVQPILNILVDAAEPVSQAFIVKGFLELMAGKEHEGKKTIKYSMTGFVGIQFIPQIMKIIKSIKLG